VTQFTLHEFGFSCGVDSSGPFYGVMETFFDCGAESSGSTNGSSPTNLIIYKILKILALNFGVYDMYLRIRWYAEGE
jgi:hypothetical protein